MSTPTNWAVPTGDELVQVLERLDINDANENTDPDAAVAAPVDEESPNRRDDLLALVVQEVRGAIQVANKFPLSVTLGAVPPEARIHVLNKAAFELVNSKLNLKMVIVTEKGAVSPFKVFYDQAVAYLKCLREGCSITEPTDPTGADYVNPPQDDPDVAGYNPSLAGVVGGDVVGAVDLSTD